MRPRLSQDCHARLFRTSFEPRLGRRLSNDGRIFGQNMDARLGSRCMSQRDAYPSRISVLDENQDNGMERDINRFKQEKKLTKKCRSASVGRAVGSAKQKEMQEELIREKARLIEQAALDLEEIKQKKLDVQIGEGGYGPVFKGVLDNTDVATHMFSVFTYVLMAISGLISNTNLTSFIASGNYQLRKDLSLQRGSIFSVRHGGQIAKNLFARKISHIEQREVYGLGVRKLSKLNRGCVHYRSEEYYDIDETKVVPVVSDEGTGEAIQLEGNGALVSPWWRRLPKRWLIVLLCFTAFLLCNMDRGTI